MKSTHLILGILLIASIFGCSEKKEVPVCDCVQVFEVYLTDYNSYFRWHEAKVDTCGSTDWRYTFIGERNRIECK